MCLVFAVIPWFIIWLALLVTGLLKMLASTTVDSLVSTLVSFTFISRVDDLAYDACFGRSLKTRYTQTRFEVSLWLSADDIVENR